MYINWKLILEQGSRSILYFWKTVIVKTVLISDCNMTFKRFVLESVKYKRGL